MPELGANRDGSRRDRRPDRLADTPSRTGLGVGFILFLGFAGFAVLTIAWFATRPREVRIVNAGPPAGQSPAPANHPPPPPAASQPAGWYPDPAGRFQYRWFDGVWTDRVANGGDGQTSVDPLQPG